jgi:hypothetical protein
VEDQARVTIDVHNGNKRVLVNGQDMTGVFAAVQLLVDAGHVVLTAQLVPDAQVTDVPCEVHIMAPEVNSAAAVAAFLENIDPEFLAEEALNRLGTMEDGGELDPIAAALLVLQDMVRDAR